MAQLSVSRIEAVESNASYGHFTIEPLEKGFGITIGNAMRRVLLSYLTGAAINRVKIDGIQHELSVIPHVKEDVTEILLNLKNVRLKSITNQPGKLTLEVEGEGEVTAGDIKPSADFEIVNPELYLATAGFSGCQTECRIRCRTRCRFPAGRSKRESSHRRDSRRRHFHSGKKSKLHY